MHRETRQALLEAIAKARVPNRSAFNAEDSMMICFAASPLRMSPGLTKTMRRWARPSRPLAARRTRNRSSTDGQAPYRAYRGT